MDCQVTISTKSGLILRDLDLLTKLPHLKAAFSVNTLDEQFRKDMDHAGTIQERLHAIAELNRAGIHTVLFMSPIFPYITDCKAIIDATQNIVSEYWFENLNLRGTYKKEILDYVNEHYPQFTEAYHQIYIKKDNTYWKELAEFLNDYCRSLGVNSINYFYHEELVKEKLQHWLD